MATAKVQGAAADTIIRIAFSQSRQEIGGFVVYVNYVTDFG
jgi:hypothetical protein